MDYALRLQNLRGELKRLKCDALAVTHLTNVRYLTGYSGTAGMVVVTRDETLFITDFRYRTQAAQQVGENAKILIAERGLWKRAAQELKKIGPKKLGFEAEHTSVAAWEEIKKLVQPIETVSTQRAVEDLRLEKGADELQIIREAVRIADEVMMHVLENLRPGLVELEIAAEIEHQIRARGGSGTSFDTIVASGARSALPHGVASEKRLEKGDLVTIDMGARFNGYCSDMTRTVCLGKATDEKKKVYNLVWQAQVAAAQALKPDLDCKAADRIARDILDAAGYKKEFGHGLGHGVGLDIHEQPRLSKLGKGKLAPGMIVTCEPGVYLKDWGGVRIEDMLVITETGAEILTGTPKPDQLLEL